MRSRIAVFIAIFQSSLLLAHWFLYKTWSAFWITAHPPGISTGEVVMAVLACSFVVSSLLAWRYSNVAVRVAYKISAVWLGFASFCLLAAGACRILYRGARLVGLHPDRRILAAIFFGSALLISIYGVVNAAWTRVKRVTVKLPNLPESWRGRVAAMVSDTHLGHVRGIAFMRRIVAMLTRLRPDIVLIGGDMYDGTAVNAAQLAAPWAGFSAPLGTYFVTGNHEEFSDPSQYLNAVRNSGVRVLNNEKLIVDGMQLVGVHFRDSTNDDRLRSVLRGAAVDRNRASILLTHAPDRLKIAEEEGISLQLSGHTHGGQFFPFTWITARIYGKFVHGLQRLGNMLVYVSYGAGTWGPAAASGHVAGDRANPIRIGREPGIRWGQPPSAVQPRRSPAIPARP